MTLYEQLSGIIDDLSGVWTEGLLILGAIGILILGLFKGASFLLRGFYVIILICAFYINVSNPVRGLILTNSLNITDISVLFGALFICVGLFLTFYKRSSRHLPEFYFFILSMLVGSLFIMKSNSFLTIYLSIELTSLAAYVLTCFSFRAESFEASIKYLLFGAASSAVMLLGLGLLYGVGGAFYLSEWDISMFTHFASQIGLLFFIVGIFFKISIVPAHLWVPATYQSAPPDAVAFMSVVPKLAGLVLFMRILEAPVFTPDHWIIKLTLFLGMMTIIFGTLGALLQKNARRMVSFGAIAHSGFLLPFALIGMENIGSFWFYAVSYALMNVAVFYLLDVFEKKDIYQLMDYQRVGAKSGIGVAFTGVLVSLAGIPPLAGFTAKFFLFINLWEGYQSGSSDYFLWYLIVAVLATVGSLFFYLQIPRQLFLHSAGGPQSIKFDFSTKILATLFCIVLLLLFFAPQLVMETQQLVNNVHE